RFRRLDKFKRRGMGTKKLLDRRGLGRARPAGVSRAKKFHELLGGPYGKSVDRVSDDVRVNVVGQMKADGNTARACLRTVVGHGGNPGKIRETHAYGSRGPRDVRCARERFGGR